LIADFVGQRYPQELSGLEIRINVLALISLLIADVG